MGSSARLGEILNLDEDVINKSCSLSFQNFSGELFLVEHSPTHVFFSFPGSWSVESWVSGEGAFGETVIKPAETFRSMKSISNHDPAAKKPGDKDFAIALVNQAFLQNFEQLLQSSQLGEEVNKAKELGKTIIFTGHSAGGATASLVTIWFLEKYREVRPFCVTFGSPLIGDHLISHALRRENWSQYFIHFVMRYDIVPRISLAPLKSIEAALEKILTFFNKSEDLGRASEALEFYATVMTNAASVAGNAASKLMGNGNQLLETVSNFVKLSPYKPFGTYIFCTGNGNLVVLKNPEAVLQLLFYSCQLSTNDEMGAIAHKCLQEHLAYEEELKGSLEMQSVTYVDRLETVALASDGCLDDLGLSTRARLCLRAAGEFVKQKEKNLQKVVAKLTDFKKEMKNLEEYREFYKKSGGYYDAFYKKSGGYYDAFKLQDHEKDFKANVSRLELAGIWDEIIEMLKTYDLPDEFEATKEWIEHGTKYRLLVEPIDIANYYRHAKDEGTHYYMKAGSRPKRYRYTQRWVEHQQNSSTGSCGESCFMADVEELLKHFLAKGTFNGVKNSNTVDGILTNLKKWIQDGKVAKEELLENTTFGKFRKNIPQPQVKIHFE